MKKMNEKGFMLTETLIVATFLVTTLLFLYIQFNNVSKTYETSFKYNTVNSLYAANNIINYIDTDGIDKLKQSLSSSTYTDITTCPISFFTEENYCKVLLENLKVKTVIFTKENLETLKNNTAGLEQTMIDFINYINFEKTSDYRLIVEFSDGTFASLKITQ